MRMNLKVIPGALRRSGRMTEVALFDENGDSLSLGGTPLTDGTPESSSAFPSGYGNISLTPETYFNSNNGALDSAYITELPSEHSLYLVTVDLVVKETTDSYYYCLKPETTVEWWDNYWNGDGSMGDPVLCQLKRTAPGAGKQTNELATVLLPGGAKIIATGHDNEFGTETKILAWPLI